METTMLVHLGYMGPLCNKFSVGNWIRAVGAAYIALNFRACDIYIYSKSTYSTNFL
ncbi:hypothetical protein C1646_710767 [Rhizophagus diaphanus]|nr:hypothetical protein C1646_710767 [Rhizophagus diaphanus] [Rhizophagus sp. MUCL 43196]